MKTSILVLAIFLYGCSGQTETPPPAVIQALPVAEVTKSSETTFTEYPASIEGTVDLEIRPQISGALDKIFINEGALVQKGQPLFKINELPFKQALNNAKASLLSAKASLLNAQLEVEKLTPLVANKVVSDFQLKSAKASYESALANVEQARAGVGIAEINLGYTLIKAPVSGYVGRLPKKQGSLVSPSDPNPLTLLSDAHEVHVYFSLGEDDFITFNSRYQGKTITEKANKIPVVSLILSDQTIYTQQGKIDMVDGQFDKQTGSISLRATFPNGQGILRSGNTGKIRIGETHNDAFLIPQSATVEMQDKVFVFAVADSNKVKKLPITIVAKSGNNYLVREGIKNGDQIVLSGIDRLQEGQEIKPEKTTQKVAQLINK
ncbi:efflux RND transporter periplasmic adaptor subunit [Pedobacter frigoris]|uniref:Efflux RND transporter periplasmic adaptor subunit n=1 Tax=Pedobacter frigoris TaxID=2571272 RepID=A0A4U1CNN6_9SPHI|nr:efflux RND transporter periplasmic adaptor subunit [Pedobacter frigoris]TKC09557.1 efflux RND transporter periplasmic adaptor subunit [Pedobacter frigoris]